WLDLLRRRQRRTIVLRRITRALARARAGRRRRNGGGEGLGPRTERSRPPRRDPARDEERGDERRREPVPAWAHPIGSRYVVAAHRRLERTRGDGLDRLRWRDVASLPPPSPPRGLCRDLSVRRGRRGRRRIAVREAARARRLGLDDGRRLVAVEPL